MEYRSSGSEGTLYAVAIAAILIAISRIATGQDLRIDSQLRILANDCYTRIAIGSRLPNEITTLSVGSLADCETACSTNRTRCNAFGFGVDSRGNGSCAIGHVDVPYTRSKDLRIDPDYDVYERRARTPWGCAHDRLARIGYGDVPGVNVTDRKVRPRFGNRLNGPIANASTADRAPSFSRGGWYWPIGDDEDTRLHDILNARRHRDHPLSATSLTDLCVKWAVIAPIFCRSDGASEPSSPYLQRNLVAMKGTSPAHRTLYEFGPESLHLRSTGVGLKTDPILEQSRACYRKLLTAKRLLDNHVRRSVSCDRIEECHRICEYESTFVCEGFNYGGVEHSTSYGRSSGGGRGYVCQLTSVSGARMDPRRDFVDDARYDYYARDWTCPAGKVDPYERGWSGGSRVQRPNDYNRWTPISLPSGSPSRVPVQPPLVAQAKPRPPYYPPERSVPLGNWPGDLDYHGTGDRREPWGSYLPQGPTYNRAINRPSPIQRIPSQPKDHYSRYYYREPVDFPNRRIDDSRIWRHHSPGPNDIITRTGKPVYDGSYGYGPNDYADYNSKDAREYYDPWIKTRAPPRKISPGYQRDRHYGQNYGPAYGYQSGQTSIDHRDRTKPDRERPLIGAGIAKTCSARSLMGFKVTRKIVAAGHVTANVEECEMLCTARTDCFSYAYRYTLVATAPTDNCLLSNVPFEKLNFYTDLEPDRDYDVYAMVDDPRDCYGESGKPGAGQIGTPGRSSEECFWRVRSGCSMPSELTRKKIRIENGLGECQIACISARHFTCRSFVYRYETYDDREANCFLSDCSTHEIISAMDSEGYSSIALRDAELYERGSYGRGCEAYPFAPIYNLASLGDKPRPTGQADKPEGCWSDHQSGCKLSPSAVASMTRVDSESECRQQCSRMRYNPHSPSCMSFSFRTGDGKHGDNCYLSDVPQRDLRPGHDYTRDDDYVMYAWKELEPQCSPAYGHENSNDGRFDYATGGEDYRPGSLPGGSLVPLGYPGSSFYGYNTLYLGVRPLDSDGPDHPKVPDYPTAPPNDETNGHGYSSGPDYLNGYGSFNRYYTVNGQPCKRGTKCEINKIAGFWSCEPEGAEFGSWDYCCEPDHHCGFSRGYSYPWCYVGASEEQWRPCSEKYYPYSASPRAGNDDRRPAESGRHRENTACRDRCEGRHWPIAFLHPVAPPNASSIASARRDSNDLVDVNNEGETRASLARVDPPETVNSSAQTHNSHLKRRGLLTPGKNLYKKSRRLTIIPAYPTNATMAMTIYSEKSTRAPIIGNNETSTRAAGETPFVGAKNRGPNVTRDDARRARIEKVNVERKGKFHV